LASSVSRALNLYLQSELTLDEFVDALVSARLTTQRQTSAIRKTSARPGSISAKAKMPYFFGCLTTIVRSAGDNDISQIRHSSAD